MIRTRRNIMSRLTKVLAALAVVIGTTTAVQAGGVQPASAATCARTALTLVAHQDDELLFINPDLQAEIDGGACATTVYLTAGDIGDTAPYWQQRERGTQAAYATMLDLDPDAPWTLSQRTFAGHAVHVATSPGAGTVTLIYLRLPDGGLGGGGTPRYGEDSLTKLYAGDIPDATTVDGSATYTREGLIQTLAAITTATAPAVARIHDVRAGHGDHPDHLAAGRIALDGLASFTGSVIAYRGYGATAEPANVAGAELARKTAALLSYADHDPLLCGDEVCPSGTEAQWNQRRYTAPLPSRGDPVPGPAPYSGPDIARNASVLASSQADGQEATAAIDGAQGGHPGSPEAEWSSDGQRAGAWIQLHWATAQRMDRVLLYDRPNGADQVTGGVLTFSDGSTVPVPALANNGSATVVTFPARSATTVRFAVTSVSEWTQNVGLSEIEAYDGAPPVTQPDPGPSATPVPGPAPYSGPDVARNASVVASSQVTGQAATDAIDGVLGGYPGSPSAEWSSDGQRSGAWIQLHWATPQQIDRVLLYDRPNAADEITGGTLTFSDGSTVTVPGLVNNGGATSVTFPARSVTTVRFTVTSVSEWTQNVGLSEIEAFNGVPPVPEPDPGPSATPVPGPAPYSGPDVARNASVLSSSQVTGQAATDAIDGVLGGYPASPSAEWSSDGQRAGAWIQLHWATAQQIDRIVLYDRPNIADEITGGVLTFSDGSTVTVPALANNGSATVVTFPARSVTRVRFAVTSVSEWTQNIGLSEIEAYDGAPPAGGGS
jgi:LmbE family N-acetylglucosaminyl deacetylase/CRISPR/Cas system CMR subunit Cmr4 (Cas7 group RAMP superfamily)